MRQAGVLMPVTSLPSRYGVGTMGAEARAFLRFLHEAKQTIWQVLPVGPTGYGDSPYQPFSSLAGNPYLIDFDDLTAQSLLLPREYESLPWGSDPTCVDYGRLYELRLGVLARAVDRLRVQAATEFATFCADQASWLDDYALFMALKGRFQGAPWSAWPDAYRLRDAQALAEVQQLLHNDIIHWKGIQYLFFTQWSALKSYAQSLGIQLFGDLPIYVAEDSADVWASPEQFYLDDDLHPIDVAGCPPDAFSATGQLWGNPLYRWDYMKTEGYAWWIRRIAFQMRLYDMVRIDHFRGFDSYYAIPAGSADATCGAWRTGPGIEFFNRMKEALGELPIIAEDLGYLTPSALQLLADSGYPGMKVLAFAFDAGSGSNNSYLPHRYPTNSVAYVGTHDNDTARGWLKTANPADVAFAKDYLKLTDAEGEVWGLMRGIWASPADIAVVQMQDLLELGSEARTNTPATLGNNWRWRARPDYITAELTQRLAHYTKLYGRAL
ncbi:4-alpha-glucanotransferase [Collinsella sp. zg1085]|uniref:4-alpha-glucanotransferase n=1 Tax=Collinsella sp. zg1085 TaxID=2844380 RepID=UPI001C0D79C9|nr:4-alpha-glucanotransferase [Collinsella sp. zg1085]QWT17374.1 4-alpha-glucanotransferase [Collinsella sp. zg1085]